MTYALLFSGQGTQHADMLPWLEHHPASAAFMSGAAPMLGNDWRANLRDPAQCHANGFAQPLITATALAAWTAIATELARPPAAVAGYSVGELAAYACAGVITPEQALALAVQRAALMGQAVQGKDSGLLSVSGLPSQQVLKLCEGLECAIQIGEMQGIYAGEGHVLEQARVLLAGTHNAVCQRLNVRVASHSRWVQSAADAFVEVLAPLPCATPRCPVATNASGALQRQPLRLRQDLSAQISHTVQWSACMDAVAERGITCVLEIGGGHTLAKMWNARHPHIPARSADEFQTLQGVVGWMAQQLGRGY
jgi:[acyl-carrier-protein] S-malonyltransferase